MYAIFNQTHIVSSWLLLALVLVHVLAALKHWLVDHDSVFFPHVAAAFASAVMMPRPS